MPQCFTSLRCEMTSWHGFMISWAYYITWNVGHDGKITAQRSWIISNVQKIRWGLKTWFWQSSPTKVARPCTTWTIHRKKHPAPMSPRWGPWCHPSFLYRHRHPSSSSIEANFETPSPRVKALKNHLNGACFFGSSQTNHLPSILPQIVIRHFTLGSKPRYHEIALSLTCRGLIVVKGSHIFYVVRPIRFGIWGNTEVCGGGKQRKATHFTKCSARNQRPGLPFLPCLPCHPSWQVPCRAYFWQEPVWICHILSRCAKKSRRKCVQITDIFWLLLAITPRKRFYVFGHLVLS